MKKNLFFKLGLFCAALVLVATCFITSAWAKYTKTVSATDTARVAKFEVTFKQGQSEVTGVQKIDIFTTRLANIKQADGGSNTIKSEKLIAPGSKGSFEIVVENGSQVSINFTVEFKLSNTDIPLVFSVGDESGDYKSAGEAFKSLKDIFIDVNSTEQTKTVTVYWKWVYDNGADADTKDKNLGETTPTVTATVTLTATQVIPA